jgi:hypothetical protein
VFASVVGLVRRVAAGVSGLGGLAGVVLVARAGDGMPEARGLVGGELSARGVGGSSFPG